jgi:hypothetical protein
MGTIFSPNGDSFQMWTKIVPDMASEPKKATHMGCVTIPVAPIGLS